MAEPAPARSVRRIAGRVARAALWLVAYVVAGKLGLRLAFVNASASPVWLPTGIALAALLLEGWAAWPLVLVGAFVVNVTTTGGPWTSLGIAIGNTAEALVGCALVDRFAAGRAGFVAPAAIARFVIAAMGATAISASVGLACLVAAGLAAPGRRAEVWATWWLGDLVGAITICPLLLLWAMWLRGEEASPRVDAPRRLAPPRRLLEGGLLVVVAAALSWLVFDGGMPEPYRRLPIQDVLWAPVLWAAFRFGPRVTATLVMLVLAMALRGTLHGVGPFAIADPNLALLMLQSFMALMTVTGLAVAGEVASRARLARELKRSNAELEEFAYVSSHDLKEPLRMIIMHGQLLSRRLGDRLGDDGSAWVQRMVDGGQRMLALIDGMLAYARIGRTRVREPVALDRVLDEVLGDLAAVVAETAARIEREPLPTVPGDPHEMRRLLQNLVGNALKFRAPERAPVVRIAAHPLAGAWEIRVSDNGIGVAPGDDERIFRMFQRLHDAGRYPGTGIGLAMCKRIVEAHDGRIAVAPTPGGGATFAVTLPDGGR